MPYLLDTSVLTRQVNPADVQYGEAAAAINTLTQRGEILFITAQNLIEFWAVATRPPAANGLGWSSAQAALQIAAFRGAYPFLADNADIFPAWQMLVAGANVEGKQVHDARLAATASAYKITQVLTFNDVHFRRFIPFGITPVHPASV